MERLRAWFSQPAYQQLETEGDEALHQDVKPHGFNRVEYYIFMLLGLATLWPFNMYLNAGPYLGQRFATDPWTSNNFQATEISVSSVVNLVTMVVLTQRQANASYPKRIVTALIIYAFTFVVLAASTRAFLDVSVSAYFAFLIATVFITSFATGLIQNGSFSYVSTYGQPTYMQSMMVGQAVAGVLPSLVQILLALTLHSKDSNPAARRAQTDPPANIAPNDALAFFATASVVALVTLAASIYLFTHKSPPSTTSQVTGRASPDSQTAIRSDESPLRRPVSMVVLAGKLRYTALAVIICFTVTMASFPIYTQQITSLNPQSSRMTQPKTFIPIAFLFWNSGDLLGRITTAWPQLIPHQRPRLILLLSVSRALLIPVYTLCNIRGRGAMVSSDTFYLVFQIIFGFTNGYVGSLCMMSSGEYVESDQKEAAGSFMGVCLILGLGIGSLLSFAFTGA